MNRFFTLLFAAFCMTAVGQVTYPYNPDGNADTLIGVTDLQDLLVVYGNPFLPSEIQVGDSSLTFWVEQIAQLLEQQQAQIDSLLQLNQSLALGQTQHFEFSDLTWIPQENNGNNLMTILDFDEDGFIRLTGFSSNLRLLVLSDTVDLSLAANVGLAEVNFEDILWTNGQDYPQQTVPLNSDEIIVIYGNSGVVEDGTNSGENNIDWTPIKTTEAINEPQAWECGDIVTHQGHDYETVSIYGRCWLGESLKFLPEVHEWSDASADEPRFYLRDYNGTSLAEALTESDFMNTGVYYNQAATKTNICPTGWHVPVVQDWFRMLPYNTSSAALDFLGSLFISPNDWPPPTEEIPLSNAYNTYPLNLQPLGRFISDASGAYWEGVGNQWYQNVPLYGMTGISYHNLNFDLLFQSTGYSTPVRCIKGTE